MGSSVRKFGGKWEARLYLGSRMDDGKRVPIREKKTFRTKFEANEWITRELSNKHHTSDMLFADWLDEWIASLRLAPATESVYRSVVNKHLKPDLGHFKLRDLTPTVFEHYYASKKQYSTATLSSHHHVMRASFRDGVKREVFAFNPLDKVTAPKYQPFDMAVIGRDDIQSLIDGSEGALQRAIVLAATCGLRRGEVCGLRWRDVGPSVITVSGSLWRGIWKPPKTGRPRRVPFPLITLRYLGDRGVPDEPVVPMAPETVTHQFTILARNLGIPITFHGLRHSHATMLMAAGVNPRVIQERLGHAHIGTTLAIYCHVIPSMQDDAVNRLNTLWTQ